MKIKKGMDVTKSSNCFSFRRSSEPELGYREPWKATKKSFESFEKDNYWYTGDVRPDIIVRLHNIQLFIVQISQYAAEVL